MVALIVHAADHCLDLTLSIHHDKRGSRDLVAAISFHQLFHLLLGFLLNPQIEGGLDTVAALADVDLGEVVMKLIENPIDEVGGRLNASEDFDGGRSEFERLGNRFVVLRLGDHLLFEHHIEHDIAVFDRPFRVHDRVLVAGPPHTASQQGGFGNRQFIERLAEVHVGGSADTVGPLSVIHLVQIEEEYLVLGELILDRHREGDVVDLALKRLAGVGIDTLGELHRESAAALSGTTLARVGHHRTGKRESVDAVMFVEPLVLGGDRRIADLFRHLVEVLDRLAVLARHRVEDMAVGAHDHRRLNPGRQHQLVEAPNLGGGLVQLVVEPEAAPDRSSDQDHEEDGKGDLHPSLPTGSGTGARSYLTGSADRHGYRV